MNQALLLRMVGLASFVAAIAITAGWSSRADAAVICVPANDDCASSISDLQGALALAASSDGHDEIRIAAGTITGSPTGNGGFVYNGPGEDNTLSIVGEGRASTRIVLGNTNGTDTGLRLNAPAGSLVSDLTVEVPDNQDGAGDYGLALNPGTRAERLDVVGPEADNAFGIECSGCSTRNVAIDFSESSDPYNIGILGAGGDITLTETYIQAPAGLQQNDPTGTAFVVRSRLAGKVGARSDGGALDIRDSLIDLGNEDGAIGVQLENANVGSHVIHGSIDGVTLVGSGLNSTGIRVVADNGTEGAALEIANTVIHGPTHALHLQASEGRAVEVISRFSAYDNSTTRNLTGPNGGTVDYTIGEGHLELTSDPGFADPVFNNFTPYGPSPLKDAGDPANPPSDALDYPGNPRACHSGSGLIRRDIGAFEFRTDPNDDCTYPETSIIEEPFASTTSSTGSFVFGSSKNPSTFLCSLDDGQAEACSSAHTTAALSVGNHKISVQARDMFGNVDQSPATFTWTILDTGPAPCEVNCKDTTAPRVSNIKVAKQTKTNRVKVRFRSNEAGSKFRCKLNGAKWRTCKSPWKTPKLKKGKNVIRIQAIDKAGNRSKVVKRVVEKTRKRK